MVMLQKTKDKTSYEYMLYKLSMHNYVALELSSDECNGVRNLKQVHFIRL